MVKNIDSLNISLIVEVCYTFFSLNFFPSVCSILDDLCITDCLSKQLNCCHDVDRCLVTCYSSHDDIPDIRLCCHDNENCLQQMRLVCFAFCKKLLQNLFCCRSLFVTHQWFCVVG